MWITSQGFPPLSINFPRTHWLNPVTPGPAHLLTAKLTLTDPQVTSHTFPHLHPGWWIRFQAKSKQLTSLEVITQVSYLAGQTNMAASWHPEDRSKRRPDEEPSNAALGFVSQPYFQFWSRLAVWTRLRERTQHLRRLQLKDGEKSEVNKSTFRAELLVRTAC